jgi:predicted RecB family nuclease
VTDDLFAAFLKCRYKAYLKLRGDEGEKSDYETLQSRLLAEYRQAATKQLLRASGGAAVEGTPSLPETIRAKPDLITEATASDANESCRLDALERVGGSGPAAAALYRPVLFVRREKPNSADRLLLAFGASVLARVQGAPPGTGKIVHGRDFKARRVELASLSATAQATADEIRGMREAAKPPPLVLNRHCQECEFRRRCRAAAVERDDLSLLGGLSAREVAALNARGIFSVTQYSYTFRPGRLKRAPGKKYDHSLQALAVREGTVYVTQRPQFPDAPARLYLDVEGLPEEDSYYLVGLHIVEAGCRRQLSFWADGEAEEAVIWASFLAAVGSVGDFVLFHYGGYESHFLDRMEARHGGDAGLIAKIRSRSVNVLSLLYARVYFPVHANDLKSVAGCLGFRWSAPGASGLQSIVWRHGWQATRDEGLKEQLLTYNREDCSALEMVERALRSFGSESQGPGSETGLRVGCVEQVAGAGRPGYGTKRFALPEFALLTKRAYFDYQRGKVLCRPDHHAKKSVRREKPRKRKRLRANREVHFGAPTACSRCGSGVFDRQCGYQKLIIDLRPFPGGLKRWVTALNAEWYRCRKCQKSQPPEDYRVTASQKYGDGLSSWIVYASISLRLTNEAAVETLDDVFGIPLSSASVSNLRRLAAERYRPTYESLLATLRDGPLVHADETRAKMKGPARDGYVWVFAAPETAVYVYAPTREGETPRQVLAGFKGVLVSDFYAAYDTLDCPQQKCLIHLVRDFNDDLLRNPFDDELKGQAGRFTSLMQAVVGTIDRYGLKKYHLNKHKRDVERFYAGESRATYASELARHYQHRFLKYRDKLFTFLDHDGVPWNNNNAENAVKRFASRRKAMGTPFTESGIRDYLLLLSIYQTLRYRNASFWRFLLSGETDIDKFAGRRERNA